ncbi:MAG: SurA N-terminal domain-containing protein, partial [Pseudomonadota bacterium]
RIVRTEAKWKNGWTMLETIRKNVAGVFAKILIALLVLSFAVWGVADVITGVGRNVVASVGGNDIGAEQFRQEYQQQLSAMSRQFGRHLTPTQARAFGIENRVLETMIGARAVDNHAKELDLSITGKALEDTVRKDPLFRGNDGNFDPQRLQNILYRIGSTEEHFLNSRRQDTIREQLTSSMLENVAVPKVLSDLIRTYRGEERIIQYFSIDPAKAVKIGEPAETDLRKTYDDNKARFMTPETRQIEALMITANEATKNLKFTDDVLKEEYEKRKDSHSVPERRKVLQLSFKDKASAEKALAEIRGGKSFEDVAKANDASETDIDLGLVTKAQLIDPKIRDAAFALKNDKVSDVVEGRFSPVLLKVTTIEEGKVPSFDEIKDKLRERLAELEAPGEIRKLQDKVDDNRLAGKSLKEISDLLGITYKKVDNVERNGNGADGKPAYTVGGAANIVSTAFGSNVGVENEVVELADGGYAWVRVLKVNKSTQKPYDTVQDGVKKLWSENQTAAEVGKLANSLTDKVKAGTSIEEVAKTAGAELKTSPAFKRNDSLPDLPAAGVQRAFSLKSGEPASTASSDGKTRVVFAVKEIKAAKKGKKEDEERLDQEILGQLRTDTIAQYVGALRKRMGVDLNQQLIDQTVGIVPRNY